MMENSLSNQYVGLKGTKGYYSFTILGDFGPSLDYAFSFERQYGVIITYGSYAEERDLPS